MPKVCDNTSTGILFWKDGKLLLVERKKYNPGFAIPAGHNDGDDPEKTARKEAGEEVGLSIDVLEKKFEIELPNPCIREGGTHHWWTIFEVIQWGGDIRPEATEVKSYVWASRDALQGYAEALERFMERGGYSFDDLPALVRATNESEEWKISPGLEPPMYIILKKLNII